MRSKRNNFTEAFRSLTALLAIGLGMTLLFVAAGLVDGTGSTKQITELCVLGLLSAFGGMLGLKMEGVLE